MQGWIYPVVAIIIIALLALPGLFFRASDRRIAKQIERERAERESAEATRIAALPKLDVSHMLQFPMAEEKIESSKKYGGTFGSRYVHMQVIDRDGRLYFCFMTEYNVHALWRSGFIHTNMEPTLTERLPSFEVDGVEIHSFPSMLGLYPHDHSIWHSWAKLHRELDQQGGRHFEYYKKYFDYGVRRETPLDLKSAS